jgi:hypothetical protein
VRTSSLLIAVVVATIGVAGCGFGAPPSGSGPPETAAPIEPGSGAWRSAVVLPPDATAFRAAAAGSGLVIGDQTAWVETDAGGWMPAEPVDKRDRHGLVEWHGRLVSWADGGRVQTSPDGLTWTDARTVPGDSNPVVVVPFANRLLLLGEGTRDPVEAWSSVDGSTWSAIDDAPAGMAAAAEVPGHRLLAVGASGGSATVWSTSDTVMWQRMPGPPPGATVSGLRGVAQGPVGVVAIGEIDEAAAAYWSSDLSTWTRSAIETGDDAFMAGVSFVRGTYVIPGQRTQEPVVWLSADGRSWTAVDLPIPDGVDGVAVVARAVDDRIVVFGHVLEVGENGASYRSSDLIWTLDPTN